MPIRSDSAEQLRFLLSAGKLRDAMVVLNALSSYRFTALYRFGEAGLENLVLVDRESLQAPLMASIPIGDSYCAFVQSSGRTFVVEDAEVDVRVEGHPKQPVVRAYCGVPLHGSDGALFGTLCHFDFGERMLADDTLVLMQEVAAFFGPELAQEARAVDIERRLDALDRMLELIASTSSDRDTARAALDEYAGPIRDDAHGAPGRGGREQVDARLRLLAGQLDGLVDAGIGTEPLPQAP